LCFYDQDSLRRDFIRDSALKIQNSMRCGGVWLKLGAVAWKSSGRTKVKGTTFSGREGFVGEFFWEGSSTLFGFGEGLRFGSIWGEGVPSEDSGEVGGGFVGDDGREGGEGDRGGEEDGEGVMKFAWFPLVLAMILIKVWF